MRLKFTPNGKWAIFIDNDGSELDVRTVVDRLSIEDDTIQEYFNTLGEAFTVAKNSNEKAEQQQKIRAELWKLQKSKNRQQWRKSQDSEKEYWKKKGFDDIHRLSIDRGSDTYIWIKQEEGVIGIGDCRIPYTEKRWKKLKTLRSLQAIPGFVWSEAKRPDFYSGHSDRGEDALKTQEKVILNWLNPKPVLKK